MIKTTAHIFGAFLLALSASQALAKGLTIVTDIAPVRAIVEDVAGEQHIVEQLVSGQVSPHDFVLKPSDVRRVQKADLIIWLGPDATPALAKLLLAPEFRAKSLDLNALEGVHLLEPRKAGLFLPDEEEDGHAHDEDHAEEEHHGHHHGADPHSWLAPENATLWAGAIAEHLAQTDPGAGEDFRKNAEALSAEIDASVELAQKQLQDPARPFVVFHDGFQYFEESFGLSAIGAVTSEDEEATSLGIVSALRDALSIHDEACVFVASPAQQDQAAPLFDSAPVFFGRIDALGRSLPEGFTYPELLTSVAEGFADCLNPS